MQVEGLLKRSKREKARSVVPVPEELRAAWLPPVPASADHTEVVRPHYEQDLPIDFFGRPTRAGAFVPGDERVGPVSCHREKDRDDPGA